MELGGGHGDVFRVPHILPRSTSNGCLAGEQRAVGGVGCSGSGTFTAAPVA
jgi:hypothetical protein